MVEVELFVKDISREAQARLGVGVEDVAVNLVLVDALCQQEADELIDFGAVGIVGKAARVGHHSRVERSGGAAAHILVAAELQQQAQHYLAGGAHLRMRNGECGGVAVGIEVVVDDDARRVVGGNHIAHFHKAVERVEVEAEHEVAAFNRLRRLRLVAQIKGDVLNIGQPAQEIGEGIGHHNDRLFAKAFQIICPPERRAHSVAVGAAVPANEYALGVCNEILQKPAFRFSNQGRNCQHFVVGK